MYFRFLTAIRKINAIPREFHSKDDNTFVYKTDLGTFHAYLLKVKNLFIERAMVNETDIGKNLSPLRRMAKKDSAFQYLFALCTIKTEKQSKILKEIFSVCFSYLNMLEIVEIDLSNNLIRSIFVDELKEIFRNSRELKILNLKNCSLNHKDAIYIGNCLLSMCNVDNLECLNLSRNKILHVPDEIIGAIDKFKNLKDFRFDRNNVNDDSIGFLLENIVAKPVEVLDLSYNKLDVRSCMALAKLFRRRVLKELCLSNCRIYNNSFKEFFDIVKKELDPQDTNHSKPKAVKNTVLDLSYNKLDQTSMDMICDICTIYSIGELYLYGNNFENYDKIKEVCKQKECKIFTNKINSVFEREEKTYGCLNSELLFCKDLCKDPPNIF